MKRIPCNFFGEGQKLYFNIARLAELESVTGQKIGELLSSLSLKSLVLAYVIGLQHEQRRSEQWYYTRLQELFDNGEITLDELTIPIVKAVAASGVLGKQVYFEMFPEELTDQDKEEMALEESVEKN